MRLLLTFFILLATINTQAALYKYTDENGEVVYSDQAPYEGAEELVPPELQVTPAIKPKPKANENPEKKEDITRYSSFQITSPKNGSTLQNKTGTLKIALAIKPALNIKAGHYINIFIDDVAVIKNSSQLSTILNHIDRGTHSIQAELREKSGKLIRFSNNVIVHVHRFSIQHKKSAR
jgi:hypothetical protein